MNKGEKTLQNELYGKFVQAVDDWAVENGLDKEGDERFIKILMETDYNFFSANLYFASDDEEEYKKLCKKIYEDLLTRFDGYQERFKKYCNKFKEKDVSRDI